MNQAKERFQEAAEALFEGDSQRAAELFASGAAASADAAARDARQKSLEDEAVAKIFAEYPEIKADRDLQIVADQYIAAKVANGMAVPDAIAEAADDVAEKFGLGAHRRPAADAPPEDPEDPRVRSAVIAEIARQRPGNAG